MRTQSSHATVYELNVKTWTHGASVLRGVAIVNVWPVYCSTVSVLSKDTPAGISLNKAMRPCLHLQSSQLSMWKLRAGPAKPNMQRISKALTLAKAHLGQENSSGWFWWPHSHQMSQNGGQSLSPCRFRLSLWAWTAIWLITSLAQLVGCYVNIVLDAFQLETDAAGSVPPPPTPGSPTGMLCWQVREREEVSRHHGRCWGLSSCCWRSTPVCWC